jgi:hypothetical protein
MPIVLGKNAMKSLPKNEVLEREIVHAFSSTALDVSLPENLCANLNDDESRQETLTFLNRQWSEVSSSHWREHYAAVYFFTNQAFQYYLPSILTQALADLDEVHLAVGALISSLESIGDNELGEWNKCRWLGLTEDQIKIVIDWLNYLKSALGEYGLNRECEIALARLCQMRKGNRGQATYIDS